MEQQQQQRMVSCLTGCQGKGVLLKIQQQQQMGRLMQQQQWQQCVRGRVLPPHGRQGGHVAAPVLLLLLLGMMVKGFTTLIPRWTRACLEPCL